MSLLATCLDELMAERGLNQPELARVTGISQTQISQYVNGDSRPNRERFAKLCKPFGEEAVRLLVAYLRDEIPQEMEGLVEVRPTGAQKASEKEQWSVYIAYSELSKRSRSLVRMIMEEGERNPKLLKLLESAADLQRG